MCMQYIIEGFFLRYLCCENILTNDKLCFQINYSRPQIQQRTCFHDLLVGTRFFLLCYSYIYFWVLYLQESGIFTDFRNRQIFFITQMHGLFFYISYSLFLATRFFFKAGKEFIIFSLFSFHVYILKEMPRNPLVDMKT